MHVHLYFVQISTFIILLSFAWCRLPKHSLNAVLPTNARLIFRGMNVTNQRIQVTQGAPLQVSCRGGQNPNWKIKAIAIVTSTSANVYQLKAPYSSILVINPVNPSNVGTYTCHMGSIQESVTVGESLI